MHAQIPVGAAVGAGALLTGAGELLLASEVDPDELLLEASDTDGVGAGDGSLAGLETVLESTTAPGGGMVMT
jgi:hypothetical protein